MPAVLCACVRVFVCVVSVQTGRLLRQPQVQRIDCLLSLVVEALCDCGILPPASLRKRPNLAENTHSPRLCGWAK